MNNNLVAEFKECVTANEEPTVYHYNISETMKAICNSSGKLAKKIKSSITRGPVIKAADVLKITELNDQVHAACSDLKTQVDLLIKRCSTNADNYNSLDQVTEALVRAGLKSSRLIVGIGFNRSNAWLGLHTIGSYPNPYQEAISIIGEIWSDFGDNLIPCFGFGDASTQDRDVFSFYPEEKPCNGLEVVLNRYREIVPNLFQTGPLSFTPIIEKAMTVVEQNGGDHHILLIIADGQVTGRAVQSIIDASKFPLSIILVGVGDGPWDSMNDNIPSGDFNNFQFVNFNEIMSTDAHQLRKKIQFALAALMDIPYQHKAIVELNLLGAPKGISPKRVARPPPDASSSAPPSASSSAPPSASTSTNNIRSIDPACFICLTNPRDMAFGCGHMTCCECSNVLEQCPICRKKIETKIKMYL